MEATTVAPAGVQPGDTTLIRLGVERVQKLRHLRVVDELIANLVAGVLTSDSDRAQALRMYRATRDRLAHELGL